MTKSTSALFVCIVGMLFASGCATTQPVAVDSLVFEASTAWKREVPGHQTRRLEYRIPAASAGIEGARLYVWNFPGVRDKGDGYIIQKTIDRWREQFDPGDATPAYQLASHSEYRVNGMPVYTVDLSGRYVAETAPGSGLHLNKPNYRMLGAYIVAPQGDYIVKLVGPAAVVAHHAEEFETFIRSVRPADPSSFYDGDTAGPEQGDAVLTATRGER